MSVRTRAIRYKSSQLIRIKSTVESFSHVVSAVYFGAALQYVDNHHTITHTDLRDNMMRQSFLSFFPKIITFFAHRQHPPVLPSLMILVPDMYP